MSKIQREALYRQIEGGNFIEPLSHRVELKASWHQGHGKDISAIANNESQIGGWLLVGVSDDGRLLGWDINKAKTVEEQISNHVLQFLDPHWTVKDTTLHEFSGGYAVVLNIESPGEVVNWNGKPYRLSGTISQEMTLDESLSLSMRLPGEDFSKQECKDEVNGALVIEFAQKIKTENADGDDFFGNIQNLSATDILNKLRISKTKAAGILFGATQVRVVHFDKNGDILDQHEYPGLFSILSDSFVDQIQSWTRKQGSLIQGSSTSTTEEMPYPAKALREVLANSVAHALYPRFDGNVVVELYPDRLVVSNNCSVEAKAFVKKWFSKDSFVKNKLLMSVLRVARIVDELGSGKNRVFRQMIESGRREPIIEYKEHGKLGRWSVTLYNEEGNHNILTLIERLKTYYTNPDHWRIATALILWRDTNWTEILERLDEHFARVANQVLRSDSCPVILVDNRLFLKWWASVAMSGQLSRRFTAPQEEQIKKILLSFAFDAGREGHITTTEAKKIIGLSDSQSETVQLSNLFRKWSEKHLIKMQKRGHWRFLTEGQQQSQVIMSLFQSLTDSTKKSK